MEALKATCLGPRYGEKRTIATPQGTGRDGGSFPSARGLAAEASLLLDFLSTVELLGNTWWAWQKACHKIVGLADTR